MGKGRFEIVNVADVLEAPQKNRPSEGATVAVVASECVSREIALGFINSRFGEKVAVDLFLASEDVSGLLKPIRYDRYGPPTMRVMPKQMAESRGYEWVVSIALLPTQTWRMAVNTYAPDLEGLSRFELGWRA